MKTNKIILSIGLLSAIMFSFANANEMSFKNFNLDQAILESKFVRQANILGVSVEEVKTAWSNNTSLMELAAKKGISITELKSKIKEQKLLTVKSELSKLVTSGFITQAQADQKYNKISEKLNKSNHKKDIKNKNSF